MHSTIPHFLEDPHFLSSFDARILRILSEYIGPQQRLAKFHIRHTIVFLGSSQIASPRPVQKKPSSNMKKIQHNHLL